jgi:transposase-like protein
LRFCRKWQPKAVWYGEAHGREAVIAVPGRHFRDEIIVLCLRWYLRYPLSYRDLEEMMAERGLALDHSTIARWVLRYAPVLNERIRSELRQPNQVAALR